MIHDDDEAIDDRISKVRVGYDDKQFRFGFVKTSPKINADDDSPPEREVFIGHCSPHHAKDIVAELKKSIDAFEKENGVILSPRETAEKLRESKQKAAAAERSKAVAVTVALVCVLIVGSYVVSRPEGGVISTPRRAL